MWENIAGDYGWSQSRSRNINVDVRYLLWVLDEVAGAQRLLDELGVTEQAAATPRAAPDESPSDAAPPYDRRLNRGVGEALDDAPADTATKEAASCRCSSTPGGGSLFALVLLAASGRRRRRATDRPCAASRS